MRLRAFLAAFLSLLLPAAAAFAHASLIGSEPADGAVLAAAPPRLELRFNEPVSPLVLRLVDADGSARTLAGRLAGSAIIVDEPGAIGPGSHALSWRVISADGHPVGGSVLFSVGGPSAGAVPGAAETVDWPLRAAIWLSRLVLYAGLFLGVGGVFFGAVVARDPRPAERIKRLLLAAALVAVPVSLGMQGLDALGRPLAAIGEAIAWRTALGTTYAATAGIAALALLAALAATFLRARARAALSLLALAGIGLALAASGHASAAGPQWLTRPAVFVHTVAVAFWLGALMPLAAALRRGGGAAALERFSAAIPFALVPLLLAGFALAAVQVRQPAALPATAYGRILIVKLALVAALLAIAALNRWRLTRPAGRGAAHAARRLALAIAVESVLAVAILGTVAAWRFTPPPRALEAAAAAPAAAHLAAGPVMAEVAVSPGRAGPVEVSIALMRHGPDPLEPGEVTLILAAPAAGIEPIRRPAARRADGTWRVEDLAVPVPGRWEVEVAVLVSEFDLVRLKGTLDIRP